MKKMSKMGRKIAIIEFNMYKLKIVDNVSLVKIHLRNNHIPALAKYEADNLLSLSEDIIDNINNNINKNFNIDKQQKKLLKISIKSLNIKIEEWFAQYVDL